MWYYRCRSNPPFLYKLSRKTPWPYLAVSDAVMKSVSVELIIRTKSMIIMQVQQTIAKCLFILDDIILTWSNQLRLESSLLSDECEVT